MPLLIEKTNNIYRKQPTQADFLRPTGVLADAVIVITAQHVATRIVETGFRYETGDNQLEVYLNGQYLRTYEWIDGQQYGEYDEWTNYSVKFIASYIQVGDIVRFKLVKPEQGFRNKRFFTHRTNRLRVMTIRPSGGEYGYLIQETNKDGSYQNWGVYEYEIELDTEIVIIEGKEYI